MRKLFIIAAFFPIAILLLMLADACNYSAGPTAEEKAKDSIDAQLKRGDYLVNVVCNCMHCHGQRDFTKFAGPIIPGTEGKGGEEIDSGIYVKNITPTVLGSWTDDEIARVLTTGITKDGDTLFPTMPYRAISKLPMEDIYSIIAYLRTLKPIPDSVPKRNMGVYPKGFLSMVYDSFYLKHTGDEAPLPSGDDKVKRGAYLVNAADCKGCHTPFDYKKFDFFPDSAFAGGVLFEIRQPNFKVNTANLTPDSTTGIGAWSEDMFLAKFKNYRDPAGYSYDPGKNNSVMPWTIFCNMKDDDLKAVYAYLRTLKPIMHKVEKWPQ
jgi:mono/diheme cytochrome c family protein